MREYKMGFAGGDSGKVEAFLNEHGSELAPEMKNNPVFKSIIRRNFGLDDSYEYPALTSPVSFQVSEDGRSLTVKSSVRRKILSGISDSKINENMFFDQMTFKLDESNNLTADYGSGIWHDINDKEYSTDGKEYSTILRTHYTQHKFTPTGIEMQSGEYNDNMPMRFPKHDGTLVYLTTVNSPKWPWHVPALPNDGQYAFDAYSSVTYREPNNLGIAHFVEGNISARNRTLIGHSVVEVHLENPHLIEWVGKIAEFDREKGEYVLTDDAKKYYPNMTYPEVVREIDEKFLVGVDNSKTREFYPSVYENLREQVVNGLKVNYGIEEPGVEQSRGMKM